MFKKIVIMIVATVCIGSCSLSGGKVDAAPVQYVKINKSNFPDPNFLKYVKKYDKNKDNKLSKAEIKAVTSMKINADRETGDMYFTVKKIKSIKGLRYFTSLKQLCVWQSGIQSFSLSNVNLEKLELHSDDLSKYKFHRCKNLKQIILSGGKIGSDTALSKFKKLEQLEIRGSDDMQYDVLGIEECSNLKDLKLANYISAETIDLSRLPKLQDFQYTGTVEKIYARGNTALRTITCRNSNLKDVDVIGCENLRELDVFNNPLSAIDVSTNKKLSKLAIDDTGITALDVTGNLDLEYISCKNTNITELDLVKNTKLIRVTSDSDVKINR